jgi:hypothetical protein
MYQIKKNIDYLKYKCTKLSTLTLLKMMVKHTPTTPTRIQTFYLDTTKTLFWGLYSMRNRYHVIVIVGWSWVLLHFIFFVSALDTLEPCSYKFMNTVLHHRPCRAMSLSNALMPPHGLLLVYYIPYYRT